MTWRSSKGGSNKDLIITGIKGLDWCSGRIPVFYTQGSGMIPPSLQSQVALLQERHQTPDEETSLSDSSWSNATLRYNPSSQWAAAKPRPGQCTLWTVCQSITGPHTETKLFTLIPIGNWPELRSACFWTMECRKKTHGHTGRTGEVQNEKPGKGDHLADHIYSTTVCYINE